ncbi:MAG: hypothetical protein LUD29_00850 [Clostridia bacterium]|nr:hypothetical protein [Clostridia bacterium]
MIRYVRCPRCDLNYINADEQQYCDVCLAEMKGTKLKFADIEDDELLEDELLDDEEATEICPVCGVNRMKPGDTMCDDCKSKDVYEEDVTLNTDEDEEWKTYLDDEDEGDVTIDEGLLEEELEELDREEEEADDMYHGEDEPDDFDESFESIDFDDEDDDEDDEDDDDQDEF